MGVTCTSKYFRYRLKCQISWQYEKCKCSVEVHLTPEEDSLAFLEMSSATNDVATLRRGILKTFEMMLKIDMETPADANSKGPFQTVNIQELIRQLLLSNVTLAYLNKTGMSA